MVELPMVTWSSDNGRCEKCQTWNSSQALKLWATYGKQLWVRRHRQNRPYTYPNYRRVSIVVHPNAKMAPCAGNA